jgi:hypothetical protein
MHEIAAYLDAWHSKKFKKFGLKRTIRSWIDYADQRANAIVAKLQAQLKVSRRFDLSFHCKQAKTASPSTSKTQS